MAASAMVQSAAFNASCFQESERMMTRFERRVLYLIIVAAILFGALTWRLFAAI